MSSCGSVLLLRWCSGLWVYGSVSLRSGGGGLRARRVIRDPKVPNMEKQCYEKQHQAVHIPYTSLSQRAHSSLSGLAFAGPQRRQRRSVRDPFNSFKVFKT